MSFSRKQKKRRHHLHQIQEALVEHHLPEEVVKERQARQKEIDKRAEERRILVERRIQEAMDEGVFDNLPGKGKPLNLEKNAYQEPGTELAYGILKNNQLAPEWIERDKEIRREMAAARQQLQSAWDLYQDNPTLEAMWQQAITRFKTRLNRLNRKIDDFNLVVPVVSCQRVRLRLADELHRIQTNK